MPSLPILYEYTQPQYFVLVKSSLVYSFLRLGIFPLFPNTFKSQKEKERMDPPATEDAAINRNTSRQQRKQILPASAPVSSLLPPIPAPQNVHSQIFALLNARTAVSAPHTQSQSHTRTGTHSHHSHHHHSHHSQTTTSSNTHASYPPTNPLLQAASALPATSMAMAPSNVQNWSLDQLGTYRYRYRTVGLNTV